MNAAFLLANLICINQMHLHLLLMGILSFRRSIQFLHLVQTLRMQLLKQGKMASFLSKEDLQQRGRVSKTVVEYMDSLGCLEGMPEANQLSLF